MNRKIALVEYHFGKRTSFYTLVFADEADILKDSETELFFAAHEESHPKQVELIIEKIELMSRVWGATEYHFKNETSRDRINLWAIPRFDKKGNKFSGTLRLFCLRFGSGVVILGNGGIKPKGVRTYQEVPELEAAALVLENVANEIEQKLRGKEIALTDDEILYDGELVFEIEL